MISLMEELFHRNSCCRRQVVKSKQYKITKQIENILFLCSLNRIFARDLNKTVCEMIPFHLEVDSSFRASR
jgi:hypothetical protein